MSGDNENASESRSDSSAAKLFSTGQKVLGALVLLAIGAGAVRYPHLTAVVALSILVGFYLLFALFKGFVTAAGRKHRMLLTAALPSSRQLPHYGVLLPVHHEANMLKRLVARVRASACTSIC
jgi:hypothetical protein